MAKRARKRPRDINQLAAEIVAEATGDSPKTPHPDSGKNPAAIARGKKGGTKGGPARARHLSPDERKKIARKAAKTRWTDTADSTPDS